jgi:hypothetical protein
MSVTELYEAYVDGKITRGAFIRRMVGFGMSVTVAAAYAGAVAKSGRAGGVCPDLYGNDLYSDLYPSLYGDLYGNLYC